MKSYPSIDKIIFNRPVWVFDKLDGSNIRAEWTRKKGFYKFGSRTVLLSEDTQLGKEPIDLIRVHEDVLDTIFRKTLRVDKVTCFFEFVGANSFAGTHQTSDTHDVVLFEVFLYKKGAIQSNNFIRLFSNKVPTPKLLHHGYTRSDFVNSVRNSTLEGMTFEGVVCKGETRGQGFPMMYKIKSTAWLDKLRVHCGANDTEFKRLS